MFTVEQLLSIAKEKKASDVLDHQIEIFLNI